MALLEIQHVTKYFDDFTAVNDVSINIETREFFTLLGPSGCGKTTLLRLIAGFDVPDKGRILLDGKDMVGVPPEKRPIHTVFQNYALFPHMTVAENIAFPLKMAGKTSNDIKSRVSKTLNDVRLSDLSKRFPHELSGGQKQRVAFARGLINQPRLLLLDEPLGALDEKLRVEMQRELIELQEEIGVTFVFITHAQNEALALSDRVAVMNQGNIEQIDPPLELYNFPANRFVADFVGKINMMNAVVLAVTPTNLKLLVTGLGEVIVPAKEHININDEGVMAVRPEQIVISQHTEQNNSEAQFIGTVHDSIYIGDVTTYSIVLTNNTRIEALCANSAVMHTQCFKVGDTVAVTWAHHCAQFLSN